MTAHIITYLETQINKWETIPENFPQTLSSVKHTLEPNRISELESFATLIQEINQLEKEVCSGLTKGSLFKAQTIIQMTHSYIDSQPLPTLQWNRLLHRIQNITKIISAKKSLKRIDNEIQRNPSDYQEGWVNTLQDAYTQISTIEAPSSTVATYIEKQLPIFAKARDLAVFFLEQQITQSLEGICTHFKPSDAAYTELMDCIGSIYVKFKGSIEGDVILRTADAMGVTLNTTLTS